MADAGGFWGKVGSGKAKGTRVFVNRDGKVEGNHPGVSASDVEPVSDLGRERASGPTGTASDKQRSYLTDLLDRARSSDDNGAEAVFPGWSGAAATPAVTDAHIDLIDRIEGTNLKRDVLSELNAHVNGALLARYAPSARDIRAMDSGDASRWIDAARKGPGSVAKRALDLKHRSLWAKVMDEGSQVVRGAVDDFFAGLK